MDPKRAMERIKNTGLAGFEPKRATGRTTRLACLALILSKEGGDVCIVVHEVPMIDYVADLLHQAGGDYLMGAHIQRDGAGYGSYVGRRDRPETLVIVPKQGGEIRIQTKETPPRRQPFFHVLVDHVVRGEM